MAWRIKPDEYVCPHADEGCKRCMMSIQDDVVFINYKTKKTVIFIWDQGECTCARDF